MPAEVVEGEIVDSGGALVAAERPWQTQAERDRIIENADEVFDRIQGRLSANTRKAYRAAWRRFVIWCADRGRTPYPLTLETLLSYLGHLAKVENKRIGPDTDGKVVRGVSTSTIEIFLAAARRVCLADKGPQDDRGWVGAHLSVTDWLSEYKAGRNKNPKTRPQRAAGARQAIMRALLDVLPDTPSGIRDRAIMLLAYYMAARRSELVNLTHDDVRWTVDGLEIYVAYSKTDQAGEGTWVAVPQNDRHEQYDPWTAMRAWLAECRKAGITSGPLFRAVNRYHTIRADNRPMDGQAVEVLVARARFAAFERAKALYEHPRTPRETRKAAGVLMDLIDPSKVRISPHSFRRGFATDARAAGWDLLEIARGGRWSPQTKVLHIYVEEIDKWLRHQNNPMPL